MPRIAAFGISLFSAVTCPLDTSQWTQKTVICWRWLKPARLNSS